MDSDFLANPIDLFAAQSQWEKRQTELEKEFNGLTRRLFDTEKGRRWLTLAMAKHNFMGSVFEDSDSIAAARQDGKRAFISDILNSAFAAKSTTHPEQPDE